MNHDDAEEYTQALGQIVSGSWRQVALAQRLGVPQALALTTQEWVEQRLGGYIRLSIPDRREAVKELTAAKEDGGGGMTTREAASVLGVALGTIASDTKVVQNRTDESVSSGEPTASPVQNRTEATAGTDDDASSYDEAPEPVPNGTTVPDDDELPAAPGDDGDAEPEPGSDEEQPDVAGQPAPEVLETRAERPPATMPGPPETIAQRQLRVQRMLHAGRQVFSLEPAECEDLLDEGLVWALETFFRDAAKRGDEWGPLLRAYRGGALRMVGEAKR